MSTGKQKPTQYTNQAAPHRDPDEGTMKWWVSRLYIILPALVLGPVLLVGGLIAVWWLVAWAIVGIFHILPLIKV